MIITVFNFPRSQGRCGGIYGNKILFISKVDFNFDAVTFEFGCIKTDLFSQQLYVLVVYRPPSTIINALVCLSLTFLITSQYLLHLH